MDHIIINHDHSGNYYAMFYLLAFLVGFIVLLWEGRRRNFPLISWMMVIATAFLFFMAGCRIIAFTETDWSYVWRFESIPYNTARSVLGGILFSIPGILLAKKCLLFKHDMLDAFAFVLPLALVVQRFGCLMAGCCYGRPGDFPWSIQYGPGSFAFRDHVQERLLSAGSNLSLPVHPVQIYEVICALLIIGLLLKVRKNIHAPGNLFLMSMALYGAFRLALEFVRASAVHVVVGEIGFGLNSVQWSILFIVPWLFLFILLREKNGRMHGRVAQAVKKNIFRPAAYFIFMTFLFLFVSRWLGTLEIISLNVVLLPMLGMLTWYLFKTITVPRFRIVTLLLPAGAFVLMSQTIAERPQKAGTRLSYTTFSGGMMSGSTKLSDINEIVTQSGSGGCYDTSPIAYTRTRTTMLSDNQYFTAALGIAHTTVFDRYQSTSIGLNAFYGNHTEDFGKTVTVNGAVQSNVMKNNSYSYSGIKPYFQVDNRLLGFGLGLNIGQMRQLEKSPHDNNSNNVVSWPNQTTTTDNIDIMPAVSLRFGNLSRFFIDYRFNNQFTPTFPVLTHQVALGFPLGNNGSLMRIGTGSFVGIFIAPSIRAGNNFIIEPYFAFGAGSNSYSSSASSIGSINMHYKFNRKEKSMK